MTLIGNGVYTYREASHLAGISVGKIRRWTEGYSRKETEQIVPPVFNNSYSDDKNLHALSFIDLIEVLFIKAFNDEGVSIQTIRKAINGASRILGADHPFAMKKLYTDGKAIFAELANSTGESDLLDLIKEQFQIVDIVLPTLSETLDFNSFDIAQRWWPRGKSGGIVIDPNRHFGRPIVDEANMSTDVIYDLYKSGHSIEDIVNWYEISAQSIKLAIDFEEKLAA